MIRPFSTGSRSCHCELPHGTPRLVVLTGGPGAGKTAVLELIQRTFCVHVGVLPESASILFGGGFPRVGTSTGQRSAQCAIFHVQDQLQRMAVVEQNVTVALCDRGTLDGLAYWPDDEASFFAEVGSTKAQELARYETVVHLRTPLNGGYNHSNPLRTETLAEARRIDERIAEAWDGHPHRHFVDSTVDFVQKAQRAIELLEDVMPTCCKRALSG